MVVCTSITRSTGSCAAGLLLSLDRLQGSELVVTQELIAKHARRAPRRRDSGRAQAAEDWLLDPLLAGPHHGARSAGAEGPRCECYAVVKREYDRLLL